MLYLGTGQFLLPTEYVGKGLPEIKHSVISSEMRQNELYQEWSTNVAPSINGEWDRCSKLYFEDTKKAKSNNLTRPSHALSKYHIHGYSVNKQ